ncbi:hypothetical protein [Rhodopirellula sallentina]|uniref:Uncharacterized protein n=1 Tax=Rhodopirellula sallentina SM41 TaxID=1263870 RepID=M5UQA2_9BACT|nr:hypothetical protein [Rhodopirellula sallentina]EMI58163.1 hypothetical protein RSSM_00400 [Rhodopirellula sallentina SM41]
MNDAPASSLNKPDNAASPQGSDASGSSSSLSGVSDSLSKSGLSKRGLSGSGSSRSNLSSTPESLSQWITSSSSVHLARSKQTWTGAGSAAGYVLRYLTPMRRLMMDIVGREKEADRALSILVAHLVKAGFSGHDKGRLRDFLVRGIRSAAKAGYDEALKDRGKNDSLELADQAEKPLPLKMEVAQVESPQWRGYWRDGILQRSWRSLERYQHARRYDRINQPPPTGEEAPREDLVHDVLRAAMSYPKESLESWAGRVSSASGRKVEPDEVQSQLELARIRFAQQIADEVAQTLETPDPVVIQSEIKALGLGKAFSGVRVQA